MTIKNSRYKSFHNHCRKKNNNVLIWAVYQFLILIFIIILTGCNNDNSVPKPRGYFRITLPKDGYQNFDTTYPYSFEYSKNSIITFDKKPGAEPYWINIEYPRFRAKIHISYKKIVNKPGHSKKLSGINIDKKDDLERYTEDSRIFANKHIPKANDIEESIISDPKKKVYGMIYDIEGIGAASPFQYWLTDSTDNFLRGALYFEVRPNNDSLAPVIDYIKKDIFHFINTIRWKK